MARRVWRRAAQVTAGIFGVIALALVTFALPVNSWRTGEVPTAEIPTEPSRVDAPSRLWIDTDAACGHGRRSDPDDCLALLLLARSDWIEIAGVSTIFGNASIEVTDRTTRALASRLSAAGTPLPEVSRGAGTPMAAPRWRQTEATAALSDALAEGPLTVLALGPLTNVAATLRSDPGLSERIDRVIAVMGHRPGHLFHPSEGRGNGILFGHGPVFSDLNFRKDPEATRALLATGVPFTLIPYEAARDVMLNASDLDRIATSGPAGAWVAESAADWLEFWRDDVGLDGFYPFDLVAASYALEPGAFYCGEAEARVQTGWAPDWLWPIDSAGLLVTAPGAERDGPSVTYCPDAEKATVAPFAWTPQGGTSGQQQGLPR